LLGADAPDGPASALTLVDDVPADHRVIGHDLSLHRGHVTSSASHVAANGGCVDVLLRENTSHIATNGGCVDARLGDHVTNRTDDRAVDAGDGLVLVGLGAARHVADGRSDLSPVDPVADRGGRSHHRENRDEREQPRERLLGRGDFRLALGGTRLLARLLFLLDAIEGTDQTRRPHRDRSGQQQVPALRAVVRGGIDSDLMGAVRALHLGLLEVSLTVVVGYRLVETFGR